MRSTTIAMLGITATAVAQVPDPAEEFRRSHVTLSEIGAGGELVLDPVEHPGELRWAKSPNTSDVVVPSPIDFGGSMLPLTQDTVLISGWIDGVASGALVQVQVVDSSPPTIHVQAVSTLGGIDPWRIAYDESSDRLYVWDVVGESLYSAPWGGFGSPLPVASALTPIATSAALSQLSDTRYELSRRSGLGVMFFDAFSPLGTHARPRIRIHHNGASTSMDAETLHNTGAIADPAYSVRRHALVTPDRPLRIKGPGGEFVVRDIDEDIVVHAGALPADPTWWATDDSIESTWNPVVLAVGALKSGHRYVVEPVGHTALASPIFIPSQRYGDSAPRGFTTGTFTVGMRELFYSHKRARIGSDTFAFFTDVSRDPRNGEEVDNHPLTTFAHVALRPPHAVPPVTGTGSLMLLTPDLALGPEEISLDPNMALYGPGPLFSLDIPDDPGLEGIVIWAQAYVVDLENLSAGWTDILGMPILGPESAGSAASAPGPSANTPAVSPVAQRQACSNCLRAWARENRPIDDSLLRRLRQALQRARH